jgi:hypothetical protein
LPPHATAHITGGERVRIRRVAPCCKPAGSRRARLERDRVDRRRRTRCYARQRFCHATRTLRVDGGARRRPGTRRPSSRRAYAGNSCAPSARRRRAKAGAEACSAGRRRRTGWVGARRLDRARVAELSVSRRAPFPSKQPTPPPRAGGAVSSIAGPHDELARAGTVLFSPRSTLLQSPDGRRKPGRDAARGRRYRTPRGLELELELEGTLTPGSSLLRLRA